MNGTVIQTYKKYIYTLHHCQQFDVFIHFLRLIRKILWQYHTEMEWISVSKSTLDPPGHYNIAKSCSLFYLEWPRLSVTRYTLPKNGTYGHFSKAVPHWQIYSVRPLIHICKILP